MVIIKLHKFLILLFFSFLLSANALFSAIFDNGLFNGYRQPQNSTNRPNIDSSNNNNNNNYRPNFNLEDSENFSNRFGTFNNDSSTPESSFNNPPPFSSRTSRNIDSRRITGVNENNIGSNRFNTVGPSDSANNQDNMFDSGIPVGGNNAKNIPNNQRSYSSPQQNNLPSQRNNQQPAGQVDTNVFQSQLPSDALRNSLDFRNRYDPRQIVRRPQVRYPDFLLFANDVICTTERGITDGMIFYTPHGTYKLRGNLITSSNDTWMISGNKVWLDNMIYFFDDSGVFLNNKVYRFTNNVMWRDGIKYTVEGSVVTAEGPKGNRRCIVSDLVSVQ
ncbi:MAG: hypothetical protein LBH40_04255 [Alphaproteobacteria bacterium]|nr:hypothetical protein [Alphaproteobacteria bacterium]